MICLKRKEEKREEKKRTRQDGKNGSSTNTTSKKYFVLLLLDEETVSFSVIVGENAVLVEFSFKRYSNGAIEKNACHKQKFRLVHWWDGDVFFLAFV